MLEILTGWVVNDYLFWGLIVVSSILSIRVLAGIIIPKADTDKIISEADEKADMEYIMHWYNHERKIVTNDRKGDNEAANKAANKAINDAATSANEAVNKAVNKAV